MYNLRLKKLARARLRRRLRRDEAARARLRGSLRSHATPRQDAVASYPQWHGTPAIVFGVPTRYIHSHNGILDDRDLDACVDLTCALVQSVTKEFLDHLMD